MTTSPNPTFRSRIFKAGAWTVSGYFVGQTIRFGSNLLMTRLLVPEMFGVMSIAFVVLYGLALISDVGLGPNVIYSKRGNDPLFLNTAWVIQIRRGVIIGLLGVGVGLLIFLVNALGFVPTDSVYAKHQLPYVVAVLSLGAVISGFESTKIFEANRNLLIHRITQIEIICQVSGLVLMLAWVYVNRSIWSLVAGAIGSAGMRVVLSHTWLPGNANRWEWDRDAFYEIIHFGKWIFLSSVLGFLINSADRLLLGGILSATALGVYAIAYLMTNSVENIIQKLITDVSFPALSEVVRDRPERLKTNYYHFQTIITSFTYIVSGVLAVSGHTVIDIIYDRRYKTAGLMLQILAVGLLAIPFRLGTSCFQALGMPRLLSVIIGIRLLVMFVAVPIGYHYFGVNGALWAIVLSNLAGVPLTIFYSIRFKIFDLRRELMLLLLIPVGLIFGKILNILGGSW